MCTGLRDGGVGPVDGRAESPHVVVAVADEGVVSLVSAGFDYGHGHGGVGGEAVGDDEAACAAADDYVVVGHGGSCVKLW